MQDGSAHLFAKSLSVAGLRKPGSRRHGFGHSEAVTTQVLCADWMAVDDHDPEKAPAIRSPGRSKRPPVLQGVELKVGRLRPRPGNQEWHFVGVMDTLGG